jgi:hypothetical protein
MSVSSKIAELERKVLSLTNQLGSVEYSTVAIARTNQKSQTSDTKDMHFGLMVGLVIETIDIWKQNRVRFFCPKLHRADVQIKQLPWAHPISAMGGFDDSGLSWVPPAGSSIALVFESGNRSSAFYIGTIWSRNRGPEGQHNWGVNHLMDEYYKIWEGHRKGYLVGPNDESQVLPPWNTESYNGFDLTSILDFADMPEVQRIITFPNIYGFKTPEKHALKMVDGDPKCNRRWKRIELTSSTGNWLMLKDDHLHYGGQWAHPDCNVTFPNTNEIVADDDVSCIEGTPEAPYPDMARSIGIDAGIIASDSNPNQGIAGLSEIAKALATKTQKVKDIVPDYVPTSEVPICGKLIPRFSSQARTGHPKSSRYKQQKGQNPYFKHENECRPYKGPETPQNNTCDLPQSGIQLMSVGGHTFVMDDSVSCPVGIPEWERSLKPFDFGAENIFEGRTYIKSATGHMIEMSDLEKEPEVRSEWNGIKLLTAFGNRIELNDHEKSKCIAGKHRGISMQTTSKHQFEMIDEDNEQCGSGSRKSLSPEKQNEEQNPVGHGGDPKPLAKKAYVKIRSGYGLEFIMRDDNSQITTQRQYIKIYCPHYTNCRGPHIHQYQESPSGPGLVFLRVAGNHIIATTDNQVEIIGDIGGCSKPNNKIELISKLKLVYTRDFYVNITKKSHIFYANDVIALFAGKDGPKNSPRIGRLCVFDLKTQTIRLSSKIIASVGKNDPCMSITHILPLARKRCNSDNETPTTGGGQ